MNKQDVIRKLASRKLWATIIGFITAVLFAFNVPEPSIEQITALISALGTLIAYIAMEGYIDAKREEITASLENDDVFS